jgi:hypothetical protein
MPRCSIRGERLPLPWPRGRHQDADRFDAGMAVNI